MSVKVKNGSQTHLLQVVQDGQGNPNISNS